MVEEETPADGDEEGWPDVYGEAPPIDDRQLTQRSGVVSGPA